MVVTPVPKPHGIYPPSLFDNMSGGSGIVMGWLVEGTLDLSVISAALDRLIAKWPLLAGRLENVGDNPKKCQVRFPAGTYPKEYATYTLTSSNSIAPISKFFTLPLPVVSNTPPTSLFMDRSTPRSVSAWISRQHPLTCWHVTRFPPAHDGKYYSCIGVTFSHKAFDGMGISYVIHALEAEMHGHEWEPPHLLHEGYNVNMLQESLDAALKQISESGQLDSGHGLVTYRAVTPATTWRALRFVFWHVWQQLWHKVRGRIFILPSQAYTMLVNRTRKELETSGVTDVHLSTGDIIVAWLFKTIYSDGTPASKIVHCSSMASGRPFFSEALELHRYPHNCFFPMPYPPISVGELQSSPLHVVAHSFAAARTSMTISHPLTLYNCLLNASKDKKIVASLPCHLEAEETLTISNTSISRTVDVDWTGAGGKTTFCRYQSTLSLMTFSNLVLLAGRAHDGGIILDVQLNKARLSMLEAAVQELCNKQ